MTEQTQIDTTEAIPAGALAEQALADEAGDTQAQPRDFEAEARHHGWTPKEDFKGDPSKWVDAETFVKRADEVMPFLKKQNAALKRDLDEMKRTMKQFADFASKAEQRAYERALADIEARHAEAVETGDMTAAKKAVDDLRKLEKDSPTAPTLDDEPAFDEAAAKAELAEWIEKSDYYGTDDSKTRYADQQANLMGPAAQWPGGQSAWLAELDKRVQRKFAPGKPVVANPGGARPGSRGGSRTYADLPPDAKKQCDRFVKTIKGFTREQYVRDYAW